MVSSGTRVPGFRGRVLVDIERLQQLGNELASSAPANVREAREVLRQKESIVNQAYLEAQRIKETAGKDAAALVKAAQEEHQVKVSGAEVLKTAEHQAQEARDGAMQEIQQITQDAQRKARRIIDEAESAAITRREGADQYAREVLFNLEERLSELLGQVRRGIDSLSFDVEAKAPAA